jgi:hypothetical protein
MFMILEADDSFTFERKASMDAAMQKYRVGDTHVEVSASFTRLKAWREMVVNG